ncbi:MAG TPA: DUF4956 domain-containing protein [Candidatus Blautia excrementigallinarum]|nr:DUF4956 domain-containing protein [Candidatus Blautia excrementigallinarum]
MREYLYKILEDSGTLTTEDIVIRILASAVLGAVVYISYWYTHAGTTYSKKFNVSLLTLTILTGAVMTVIGNNVALSLGMVGALSIVRFRTAIKDTRDTTYIFWAIIIGICCGVGDYKVAGVGSAVVFLVLLFLGRVRNENRMLLIIRAANAKELDLEGVISRYYNNKALLKVKNTTPETVELIYELTRKVYMESYKNESDITEHLYALGNVEYVNIVTQSDEISG